MRPKSSQQHKHLPQAGDAAAAIGGADVTIDVEYGTPTQHHNPIELFSTTCVWTGDHLTIYEPSQFVYGLKNGVAERLGIEPEKVARCLVFMWWRIWFERHDDAADGDDRACGQAAQSAGQTCRDARSGLHCFYLSRRNATSHSPRSEPRRKLVGYSHEGWEISSRPDPYAVAGVEDSAQLYAFSAVATKVNIVHADRNTPGFMRSPPVVPYIYALESAMDEIALKLNMDPVEFRRINDTTKSPVDDKPYSSRTLMTLLRSGGGGIWLATAQSRTRSRCETAIG